MISLCLINCLPAVVALAIAAIDITFTGATQAAPCGHYSVVIIGLIAGVQEDIVGFRRRIWVPAALAITINCLRIVRRVEKDIIIAGRVIGDSCSGK